MSYSPLTDEKAIARGTIVQADPLNGEDVITGKILGVRKVTEPRDRLRAEGVLDPGRHYWLRGLDWIHEDQIKGECEPGTPETEVYTSEDTW